MTDDFEPMPPGEAAADPLRLRAALFLAEVLDMRDSASQLASDLADIKRDTNAAIFTIQLDSSVGPAAFLVYAYLLDDRGGDGHTGRELFDTGLETLRLAAQRETPGPRAVAHAEDDAYGFILATTPGTYRALTGAGGGDAIEASEVDLIPTASTSKPRGDIAQDLLETLRTANELAIDWLRAIQIASQANTDRNQDDELLEFNEDETELALFLLDNSVDELLRVMNLLVTTAQQRADTSIGPRR